MFLVIPGELISLLTFPGVIIHEIAHRFFCDRYNIKVFAVRYFKFDAQESGYVVHEKIHDFSWQASFFVATGPLWINSLLGMILLFPCVLLDYAYVDIATLPLLMKISIKMSQWVGYSVLFNAIPSNVDINNRLDNGKFFPVSIEILWSIIAICSTIMNMKHIGGLLKIAFAYGIGRLLPILYYYWVL